MTSGLPADAPTMYEWIKANPYRALFWLMIGSFLIHLGESCNEHKRCASSDVRGETYTVCEP
jgi:hypothetical protein